MNSTFSFTSFLLFTLITLFSYNIYSQQIEYNIHAVYGINGNKINDSTIVAGKVGQMAGLWENGNVTIFPFLPGDYNYTEVYGLNNSKQMVGMNYYYGTDWVFRATKWENSSTIDLGVLPGFVSSRATGINSNGVIVGNSSMGNVGDITADSSMSFQFVNNMQMINIPPGYRGSAAWDINDANSIAGIAVYYDEITHEKLQHAAIWQNGLMSDINGTFDQSQGLGINNNNQVCGWGLSEAPPPLSNFGEACIWTDGIASKLGILPGYNNSYAYSINDNGIVVGECTTGYPTWEVTGFVWKNNTMIDLNTLISPDSGVTITKAVDINNRGQILVRGTGPNTDTYILKPIELTITKPSQSDLFIAGQKDTIKWENGNPNQDIAFKYSLDGGSTYTEIPQIANTDSGYFVWDVPDDLLSTKAMIKVIDYVTGEELAESELFRIKPYIITKLDENDDYVAYDIQTDRWGFGNDSASVWPDWWYARFNYQGTDPFTNKQYSRWQGDSVFVKAKSSDHPDWVSFVNTFGIAACYADTYIGIYNPAALLKWKSNKSKWGGSCFGMAVSSALAFSYKDEFLNKYQNFPDFIIAHNVVSDTNVIPVINELFSHQLGNPHLNYRNTTGILKTPTETIRDIKVMLKEDSVGTRTLSFNSNSLDPANQGGHAILAYKLKQDPTYPNKYYVYVYDNSYPNTIDARILVDTSYNGGIGKWDPEYGWDGWEGDKWFYLRDSASTYLSSATLSKSNQKVSPVILTLDELEIYNPSDNYIVIENNSGNQTGYTSGGIITDIPNSVPLIIEDGSIGPPYGYHLPTDNYSIVINNFSEDTINTFFFTGNKSFEYERYGATETQTDRLFFDGGVSVTNPDNESKTIKLLNIVSDTTQMEDRLFVVRHLDLIQNDSVKIENVDNDKLKLISYGSTKDYGIGLEYTSESNFGLFGHLNVGLSANTTHTFIPNWSDITNSDLTVYVDIGNNGTIDDTLYLQNQITSVGEDQGSLIPTEYRLEQNYPNPFNNSTVIRYSIPKEGVVTLKIYNSIGEEVSTLVNEVKQTGNYEVTFSTEKLTSGVYFYRLKAGDFVETKKMVLMK